MTARACYLERADRGARLEAVRFVGPRIDERWTAPADADQDALLAATETPASAAAWIADRLGSTSTLDILCLDPDGAIGSWISAESEDPTAIAALAQMQAESAGFEDDAFGLDAAEAPTSRFPDLPGEIAFEPLMTSPNGSARGKRSRGKQTEEAQPETAEAAGRVALIAEPETPARALVDALDSAGIDIRAAVSIWHAAANAWDPSATKPAHEIPNDPLLSVSHPLTAVILIDPRGRLIWCWSNAGAVVACGSMRCAIRRPTLQTTPESDTEITPFDEDAEPAAMLTRPLLARLAGDWLGWAAQTGVRPERAVVIASESACAAGPGTADDIDAAALAAALRRAAPDISIDLVHDDDPIALTLRKLTESVEDGRLASPETTDGRAALTTLSNRPGRRHRRMYQSVALALTLAAVTVAALAYQLFDQAATVNQQASRVEAHTKDQVNSTLGNDRFTDDPFWLRKLSEQRDTLRGAQIDPNAIDPPRPMVETLESLSYILGVSEYELVRINITPNTVQFSIRVDDVIDYEAFVASLNAFPFEHVAWNAPTIDNQRGKIVVNTLGRWVTRRANP